MNRGMILAPLVGIILNLLDASAHKNQEQNDLVEVLASMDCPATVHCWFKFLLDYNWVRSHKLSFDLLDITNFAFSLSFSSWFEEGH